MVDQYIDISSINLPAAGLDFVTFVKPFDRLYVYSNLEYQLIETLSERHLRSREGILYFMNWHFLDLYVASS